MTIVAEPQRVSTERKHNVRSKEKKIDHRVLAANRLAAEMLTDEAERGNSRVFKLLAFAVSLILGLTFWWAALKLTSRF